jgi:phage gp36-like protein
MAYCSRVDLVQRFGESEISDLLDRNNDSADDDQALSATTADADALIDGYLGSRYSTPLATVPNAIRAISCDITRYLLWDDNAPTEVRTRYEDALARLKDYAKGFMVLPNVPPAETNPSGGIDFIADDRVFSRDSLAGF